jgi:ATP-dependent DNA helicase RecG
MSNGSLRVRLGLAEKQYPQMSLVIADARDANLIRALDEEQGKRNARYVPYWFLVGRRA